MFDLDAEDVSHLNDEDLRELVGRLCEAEVRRMGQSPVSAVTWGGNQTATDGGVDVRVALPDAATVGGAIARSNCIFQVKAEDMDRARILAEMKPKGILRKTISELAEVFGSYIIVSSKGSVSYTSLANRRAAMSEAVKDVDGAERLHLDFYDRNRIATWVRDHPGVALWARWRIGKEFTGWEPYGDWSKSNEPVNTEYLMDDSLRIQGADSQGGSSSALQGIQEIRKRLDTPGGVVRLVGLSGTGKTRLAEALFDTRVGKHSLGQDLAVYTNLSDNPTPQPAAIASQFVAQHRRSILVVDNCQPELHNSLSVTCRQSESMLSLLTIEYDVRDDQPEGTDVFELQPSSDDLIEKLLQRRFATLSWVDAHTIANFSSGNARVAIALASTVRTGESIAALKHAELFERLFQQRNAPNSSLLRSAQACSLVYSFQGDDIKEEGNDELWRLANLIGSDLRSVHSDLAELKRRGLLQQRGVWRAILPHAIANTLATRALEDIVPADLRRFWETAPPRLLKSFSRRLGYLHTSRRAQTIVTEWLSPDGLLGHLDQLNELRKAILTNVAPVDPLAVIDAIERTIVRLKTDDKQLEGEEFRSLLVSLAYDSETFDRAVNAIIDLIEHEKEPIYANYVKKSFPHLFHLVLSGTHATVEQRLAIIESLVGSNSETRCEFGFSALAAMLQTSNFSSSQRFDFGGRPRNFGFYPQSRTEVLHWFDSVLQACSRLDKMAGDHSIRVRRIMADHLRGLWRLEMFDEIERLCAEFQSRRFWPEAWTALRSIRRFRNEPLPEEQEARLLAIEHILQPSSVAERVRALVLRNARDFWDDVGVLDVQTQLDRLQAECIELGNTVVKDNALFEELLPELIYSSEGMALIPFAKGIAESATSHRSVWGKILLTLVTADSKGRCPQFATSYLFNLRQSDDALVEKILDELLADSRFDEWFPFIQIRVGVNALGVERLKQSIERGTAPVDQYRSLAYAQDTATDQKISALIPSIALLPGGQDVAFEMVWTRLSGLRRDNVPASPELVTAGRQLLENFDFNTHCQIQSYHLEEVTRTCLSEPEDANVVREMLGRLRDWRTLIAIGLSEGRGLIRALFAAQPLVALDTMFADPPPEHANFLFDRDELSGSPLDCIPQETLLAWCDVDSARRYPRVASFMVPFITDRQGAAPQWKDISLALLGHAPDRISIMKNYVENLWPSGWSGSQASAWEAHAKLLDLLPEYNDPPLAAFVAKERTRLNAALSEMRRDEEEAERRQNERFE